MTLLYLASKSPQRQALLLQIGLPFQVIPKRSPPRQDAGDDERPLSGESPQDYVQRVATMKALTGLRRMQMRRLNHGPVLGADTTVVLNNTIIGKPNNAKDAGNILRQLSGSTHQVFTALDLRYGNLHAQCVSQSMVTIRPLSDEDIENYLRDGEYQDKAGAYGIQGRAALFIKELRGSYSGVMGLPLYELDQLLARLGLRSAFAR